MARNDTKKGTGRQIVERTQYGDGTILVTFTPELYGEQPPTLTVLADGTRIILPDTTTLERWVVADRAQIAAHLDAVLKGESAEFVTLCQSVLDERSGRAGQEKLAGYVESDRSPCGEPLNGRVDTTEIAHQIRHCTAPLMIAYGLYLIATHSCVPPVAVADEHPLAPLAIQKDELYISRVVFADVLYGPAGRRDIFVSDDVVLTIPNPFRWDGWLGEARAAYFGRVNRALVDDATLQRVVRTALSDDGDGVHCRQIREALPAYRQRLRAAAQAVPLTRLGLDVLLHYLMDEASPLERALVVAAMDGVSGGAA